MSILVSMATKNNMTEKDEFEKGVRGFMAKRVKEMATGDSDHYAEKILNHKKHMAHRMKRKVNKLIK